MTNRTELTAERIELAIKEIADVGMYGSQVHQETMETALAALRAEQERLNPQPLTVEEMNELNKEPVYIMHVDTIKNGALWHMNGWHILTASTFQNHGQCKWFVDNGWSELDGNYGKTWLAYRTKPEGSAE